MLKNRCGERAHEGGGDATPPVFRQHIDANLPHGIAVGKAAGQPDKPVAVKRAHRQNIQLFSLLAQGVAPLRKITGGKIIRTQELQWVGAGQGPELIPVRQEIFRHKTDVQAERTQCFHQNMHVWRFKTVLDRIPVYIGLCDTGRLFRHGCDNIVAICCGSQSNGRFKYFRAFAFF